MPDLPFYVEAHDRIRVRAWVRGCQVHLVSSLG